MPRKKKHAAQNGFGKFRFVNVDFNAKARTEINLWSDQRSRDFNDVALAVIDAGFKLSASYNDFTDSYQCSVTEKGSKDTVKRVYVLRHNDFTKLLKLATYFFVVMLDNGNAEYDLEEENYDW